MGKGELNKIVPISLAFFSLSLPSCSGGNHPVLVDKEPIYEAVEATTESDDSFDFLAYYPDRAYLTEVVCRRESSGCFRCRCGDTEYSSKTRLDTIYIEYDGETKEGFIKKCFEVDPPISYFNFNDFLPYFKTIANASDRYYYWTDLAPNTYDIVFDQNTNGYQEMVDFLKPKAPPKQLDDFLKSNELSLYFEIEDCAVDWVILEGHSAKRTKQLFRVER